MKPAGIASGFFRITLRMPPVAACMAHPSKSWMKTPRSSRSRFTPIPRSIPRKRCWLPPMAATIPPSCLWRFRSSYGWLRSCKSRPVQHAHAESAPEKRAASISPRARSSSFPAEAMRVLAAQGFARLFLLKAGGAAVSALYVFSVGQTFQFYQCGIHPGWVRYGLGQVLIGNAIEQTIAAGHATFDFLRGDESYKTQWADRSHENTTLRFF